MKVLTITQPWATLIAIGAKKIETRSWYTRYRGPLAIHAAMGFPREAIELCFEEPFAKALLQAGISVPNDLPRGVIIAICDLAELLPTQNGDLIANGYLLELSAQEKTFGDYSDNRYGLILHNVQRLLHPIPAKGALGLWEYPVEDYIR